MRKQPDSWRAINRVLRDLTEEELQRMIEVEMSTHRRVVVVERLHQRLSAMRTTRERLALMNDLKGERRD